MGAKQSPEVTEWLGKIFKTCNSFVGDTPVLMADGTTKPIRDVQVGDEVLATDPTTGETAAREVTDLITGTGDKELVRITVDTDGVAGDRTDALTSTAGHPFWVTNRGAWLDAKDLVAGDRLRRADGSPIELVATTKWTEHKTVYNLTIDGIHTYYVKAASSESSEVLVHNSGMCTKTAENALSSTKRLQHGWRHLEQEGIVGPWKGKASPGEMRDILMPILTNPTKKVAPTIWKGDPKDVYVGMYNGQYIAVQVYTAGPMNGQLATTFVPNLQQLRGWGVVP